MIVSSFLLPFTAHFCTAKTVRLRCCVYIKMEPFPVADGRIKLPGGDQDLRTSTLIRDGQGDGVPKAGPEQAAADSRGSRPCVCANTSGPWVAHAGRRRGSSVSVGSTTSRPRRSRTGSPAISTLILVIQRRGAHREAEGVRGTAAQ